MFLVYVKSLSYQAINRTLMIIIKNLTEHH